MKFPPTPEQAAIFKEAEKGEQHIMIEAVAGSGKTTTLLGITERAEGKIIIIAFNKSIADELSQKLPKPSFGFGTGTGISAGAEARTIHSIGKQVLEANFGQVEVKPWKYRDIVNTYVRGLYLPYAVERDAKNTLRDLISLARLNLIRPDNTEALQELAVHHDVAMPELVSHVMNVFEIGMKEWDKKKTIDFDDMIFLPILLQAQYPLYDKVLVDECQDLNKLQFKTSLKLAGYNNSSEIITPIPEGKGQLIYVGDRRQAIYGFAGADARSFQNIADKTGAKIMDLTVCFRCPVEHIKLAQKIVPQIKPRENAPAGVVRYEAMEDYDDWREFYFELRPGDLLLCRLNAPIIKACIQMIREGIKARVRGMSIGKKLTGILHKLQKMPGFRFTEVKSFVDEWRLTQIQYLDSVGAHESAKTHVIDMAATLKVIIEEYSDAGSITSLCDRIEKLFEDTEDAIWLSSIHRAKGLEGERIFLLYPDKVPLRYRNQQDWELEQEFNLKYVALTRSKDTLVFVSEPRDL